MMEGLDSTCDAVLFVGYHGRAGSNAVLSHTFMGKDFYAVKVNGEVVGEMEINALIAAAYGVPVVMVTGDDVTCRQAHDFLGQAVITVPVKRAIDRFAAECLPPAEARERIKQGAAQSLGVRKIVAPVALAPEYEVVLDLLAPTQAWICGCMPGVERTGERQVTHVVDDPRRIFPFLMASFAACRGVTDAVY
jgi:D-amino peptidase